LTHARIDGKPHNGRYWQSVCNCLGRVSLGEDFQTQWLERLPRRQRTIGRSLAMAGCNAASVYANALNPDRIRPMRSAMFSAVQDAAAGYSWHRRLGGFRHRRAVHEIAALEQCVAELEGLV